jgi:transcriptional regulator with XRE-family HTH domain
MDQNMDSKTAQLRKEQGNRITQLRKELGKKQTEFASGLGLTSAAISAVELGKAPLTEANIRLVSLAYEVNEEWLRYGTGKMRKESAIPHDSDEITLISLFRRLTAEMKRVVLQKVEQLSNLDGSWAEKSPESGQSIENDPELEKRA